MCTIGAADSFGDGFLMGHPLHGTLMFVATKHTVTLMVTPALLHRLWGHGYKVGRTCKLDQPRLLKELWFQHSNLRERVRCFQFEPERVRVLLSIRSSDFFARPLRPPLQRGGPGDAPAVAEPRRVCAPPPAHQGGAPPAQASHLVPSLKKNTVLSITLIDMKKDTTVLLSTFNLEVGVLSLEVGTSNFGT